MRNFKRAQVIVVTMVCILSAFFFAGCGSADPDSSKFDEVMNVDISNVGAVNVLSGRPAMVSAGSVSDDEADYSVDEAVYDEYPEEKYYSIMVGDGLMFIPKNIIKGMSLECEDELSDFVDFSNEGLYVSYSDSYIERGDTDSIDNWEDMYVYEEEGSEVETVSSNKDGRYFRAVIRRYASDNRCQIDVLQDTGQENFLKINISDRSGTGTPEELLDRFTIR